HGDCHPGNLLWDREPFFVDFDDMVRGPVVQDLWLLLVGQGERAAEAMGALLEGYEQMRPFDRAQLGLVEPLRALRYVHYTAWLARRWKDPAFPRAFPHFGTPRYWVEQLQDLREQLAKIQEGAWA
ncbi:MAG: phosphotransferase, partial [Myxococcales bacterium]|nr:phosphotransferase [Myxococcales bacterium]